jgi:hypothetical protein
LKVKEHRSTNSLELGCEVYKAPPPAKRIMLPDSTRFSENIEFEITASVD